MAAARRAVRGGLSVIVLDLQSQPGGQIWRNAGRNATSPIINILGAEYRRGVRQVEAFLACGADYIPDAQVSRLSQGWTVEYVWGGEIRSVRGRHLLLATGAQERPVPFTGWTLPGVMTVGAAQILLKTAGQLPRGPVAVVGSGPLPLLYMQQMRLAGGKAGRSSRYDPSGSHQPFAARFSRSTAGAWPNPERDCLVTAVQWRSARTQRGQNQRQGKRTTGNCTVRNFKRKVRQIGGQIPSCSRGAGAKPSVGGVGRRATDVGCRPVSVPA
ncbi:hypothetical protein [Rhizobium nepotum]|uniref:hypothetical protein n=1 Tax=Rhizobium nepotum TaxID=1035271 RepID=UPI003CE7258B